MSPHHDPVLLGNALANWFMLHMRDLPWRCTRDPYKIWVSEVMLQQTRVETVISYYNAFLARFPDVRTLALATLDDVLKAWEGLGYYRRARNLYHGACYVHQHLNGVFPDTTAALKMIPGIGDYTAGAIASLAFGHPVPAVDGNVMRVLSRIYGLDTPIDRQQAKQTVSSQATSMIPPGRSWEHNQALMELGATVCIPRHPHCSECPVMQSCAAFEKGMQDILPVIPPRKKPLPVSRVVFVATAGSKVILRCRDGDELLAGLWEFPGIDMNLQFNGMGAAMEAFLAMTGCKGEATIIGHARHVFTHRVWEMDGIHVSIPENASCQDGYEWIPLDELDRYAMATAFRYFRKWLESYRMEHAGS